MKNTNTSEKGSEAPEARRDSVSLDQTREQAKPRRLATLFVMNRKENTAAIFAASCFEELQAMFRVGIMLPDGITANGIGRCKSVQDFLTKAAKGGTRVQSYE